MDHCADVGVAGLAEPHRIKCLHARTAAFMGGIDDPVGRRVTVETRLECEDDRCLPLLLGQEDRVAGGDRP